VELEDLSVAELDEMSVALKREIGRLRERRLEIKAARSAMLLSPEEAEKLQLRRENAALRARLGLEPADIILEPAPAVLWAEGK